MSTSTLFRYHAIDEKGVISGARAHFRQGSSNAEIYTDEHLRVKGLNPWKAKADGRFNIYLPLNERYEVTITRPDGTFVDQFIHTALPAGGVEQIIETAPAPEPEVIEKIVEVVKEVPIEVKVKDPETEARLTEALEQLERAQSNMEERKPEPVSEEPPEAIADLFDPNLTARQNQEALQKKYAALMSERELELTAGNGSKAMELLKRAERFESGITWNRARLAEVI
jgi:hypothetical protein